MKIKFDPATTPKVEEAKLNSYGLDLTSLEFITYQKDNLEVEVTGGINLLVLNRFNVQFRIARRPQQSPLDVYRNNVDLYNEQNTKYFIKEAATKLKMDSTKIAEFVYDLTERLESYRRDKVTFQPEEDTITPLQPKEKKRVNEILKSHNLLECIQDLFAQTGVPCSKTALQLFIMSLSSKTTDTTHTILQGSPMLTAEIIQTFAQVLPVEVSRFKTSISDSVLYYTPSKDYWNHKVLMLPTLDKLGKKNVALTELLTQGMVNRLVTENTERGNYRAENRLVNGNLSFISATSKGYHELMQSDNVLALPLQRVDYIKETMLTRKIRQHAGMINPEEEQQATQLLQQLFRELQAVKVINPYLDQVDLESYFNGDIKLISQFLRITNLITLLHQKQLGVTKAKGMNQVEVKPEHMLLTLEVFEQLWVTEEKELYFNIAKTLEAIKEHLKKENKENYTQAEFKVKEMRATLKMSPPTISRHINTMYDYGKIERTGGNTMLISKKRYKSCLKKSYYV